MYIKGLDQYYIPTEKKYPSWVEKLQDEQEEVQARVWCLEGLEKMSDEDEEMIDAELCRLYDRLSEIKNKLGEYA